MRDLLQKLSMLELYANRYYTISVVRSPFFSELVLSVGGWTFCLWKEGLHQGPIFESSCSDVRRLSGCWSPSRPGVFFIGRTDGYLEVWDLMDRSHEPIMKQNVSSSALTALDPLSLTKELMLLAIGDSNGTLNLLQVRIGIIFIYLIETCLTSLTKEILIGEISIGEIL